VLDLRIGYEFKKHFKFSIIMNNVLNRTYSLRPMNPEPPRNTSFQVIYKL
jgi:outer membrane receptor for ferric coprogen and ferric-rhodotorulic acid